MKAVVPQVQIHLRQRRVKLSGLWLRQRIQLAVPLCLAHAKGDEPPLSLVEEVEISVISDAAIGKVHGEFLSDPEPTDVITFHHGEILVSADTAARMGPEHGLTVQEEVLLYMIHGLMHLAGWEDAAPQERAEMHRRQDAVLRAVLG
jgi:probable rRNA maturation factor